MNYTIDVQALEDYIRYLKDYQKRTDSARQVMQRKLNNVHSDWDDKNYLLTEQAMGEIERELYTLFTSMEETVKILQKMTRKYDDYLRRRR